MRLNAFTTKLKKYTIAFYNIENLFDIYNDKVTRENDALQNATRRWTVKRYQNKIRKLSFAISNIGKEEAGIPPVIIGLAEVENEAVINDIVSLEYLNEYNYKCIHYNSPDVRGIDVALLYNADIFKVAYTKAYSLTLIDDFGVQEYTRDILLVSGLLDGLELHLIVNHWPSRRLGDKSSEYKRVIAANKVTEIITELKEKDPNAKVIIMGDFNDDPSSKSINQLVESHNLYNPMDTLLDLDRGTTMHYDVWNLFDQFLITPNLFERKKNALRFYKANIFDADFLKQQQGKDEGNPFRTYAGKRYLGGYSDHFPVYMTLTKT
ncbi:endonuclease [Bizionia gelidisalsuginis]|uniref:Endonuclease n=1 Tax=Bizionia gelidisalsuginis TaxID=291188 RepID=A0ABY3M9A8_9FLAO|nr:endonuclease/exonuclease/phosphatase family protein [Bizionia gelidisalsuginis]TYC11312.1 endonuclease [Bizionia gelidisalsuginis]